MGDAFVKLSGLIFAGAPTGDEFDLCFPRLIGYTVPISTIAYFLANESVGPTLIVSCTKKKV